jgi:hypothetical protein
MFIDYLHIAKQAELKPQNRLQRRDMFMTVIIPRVECFTASRGCEVLGEHDREMRCACANPRAAVSILPSVAQNGLIIRLRVAKNLVGLIGPTTVLYRI